MLDANWKRDVLLPQAAAGPLPMRRARLFASDNLRTVQDFMSSITRPHDIVGRDMKRSDIRFRINQARLPSIVLNAMEYGHSDGIIRVTGPAESKSHFFVQISLTGSAMIMSRYNQIKLAPGSIIVHNPNTPLEAELYPEYRQFLLSVPIESLETVLRENIAGGLTKPLEFTHDNAAVDFNKSALYRMLATICDDIDRGDGQLLTKPVAESVERSILELLLLMMPSNYSASIGGVATPVPYYVKRVERLIQERGHENLRVEDMVAESGVSARSLFAGFRQYRDTTPMNYLKAYRMELARDKLKSSSPIEASVTEIAYDCGFSHLSKFARDYQLRYGEKPSETLRAP